MKFEYSESFAKQMDDQDPLAKYRGEFHIPNYEGKESIYFTGNSLGAQPKRAKAIIDQELEDWKEYGVEGHFHAKRPWVKYHEFFSEKLAKVVGAKPNEVVAMNTLTVNLHLLMVSFYRPTEKKYKIICEGKAFPSDQYALETHVKHHGFDPKDAIIEVGPSGDHQYMSEDEICALIEEHKDELALVMFGGVNYYTGQVLDMKRIAAKGHEYGINVGFDLAHGAGNYPLQLHDWDVDFACWCSYKYMNSGPGSIAGAYVHEKWHDKDLHRFAGWWGHNKEDRFLMEPGFQPIPTVESWQLSNAPVFAMAAHLASLELFEEIGMDALRAKSLKLTGYLEYLLAELTAKGGTGFEVITPKEEIRRGCQLSILVHGAGKTLFDKITEQGVIADWREPNVIRVAPVPMYNSFMDVYNFAKILEAAI